MSDPVATQKLDAFPAEVDKLKIDDQDLLQLTQQVKRFLRNVKGERRTRGLRDLLYHSKDYGGRTQQDVPLIKGAAGSEDIAVGLPETCAQFLARCRCEETGSTAVPELPEDGDKGEDRRTRRVVVKSRKQVLHSTTHTLKENSSEMSLG